MTRQSPLFRVLPHCIAFALLTCPNAFAQVAGNSSADELRRRSNSAIDAAMQQAQARAEQQRTTELLVLPGAQKPAVTPDPVEIAESFKQKLNTNKKERHNLLVFVSTSMPKRSLTMLGEQAKVAGAVLVFRGIKGRFGTPNAMNEMLKELKPIAETGASIQIDPESFSAYDVRSVPTFVLVKSEQQNGGCSADLCRDSAYVARGDATLTYVLEAWANEGGDAELHAKPFLQKLREAGFQ